ncbi:hypothetical protein K469DRAFT_686519 [Zopfia rhizophila CBS 207.26]|uniref:BTB/POZ domain-containing protein n=1 Tax=Zopfia rhizophila CBS 207.26 TaxID=1314779 RepID=A0A6A6ESE8_9PEZI|nr:hypothetical protein K469DRAFT_686519 [Zopfia rhizophila CBS 207.26]
MPDQSGRSTSRDFAFQSTDQAFAHSLGGAKPSTSTAYGPNSHDRYDAERTTNAANASSSANQTPAQEVALRFPGHNQQQSSLQSQAPGQFPTYGFSPGGPLVWDWNDSIEFPGFTNQYEPQGELVQELQNQSLPNSDFSIPLPVTNPDTIYQSPQHIQSSHSTTAQSRLSPPKPPQRPAVQTGMKRKAESEPNSAVSQAVSVSTELQQPSAKRVNKSRSSSSASATSPAVATASEARRASMTQTSSAVAVTEAAPQSNSNSNTEVQKRKEPGKGTGPQGRVIDVSKPRRVVESPGGADILPAGKVFPIQIGSELFRLSGASISSDDLPGILKSTKAKKSRAPSYFSHFFSEQLHANTARAGDLRTLYIDRDPETFHDIALHLQGYHVKPRDGEHFVRLFADAQFYSLPRLTKQLFSTDIFIRIGGLPFQIPRDLFSSPGDSPNYFSLGFAQFFSTPSQVFPGLDRNSLLRPPSISPPSVPSRSGETFAELIKMLQGYNVEIRSEAHRAELLRDARYFLFKGLEQRLIPCDISFNLKRNQSEILLKLEDIRQSGVTFTPDAPSSTSNSGSGSTVALSPAQGSGSKPTSPASSLYTPSQSPRSGTVSYARPYTDDHSNTNILVLEISTQESTTLHFPPYPPTPSSLAPLTLNLRATFHDSTLARVTSLFSVIASKMGLPATQPLGLMMMNSGGGVATQPVSPANSGVSERRVRVRWEDDAYVEIDGSPVELGVDSSTGRLGVRKSPEPHRDRVKTISRSVDDENMEGVEGEGKGDEWLWGGPKQDDGEGEEEKEWIVRRAHWRLRVEPVEGDGNGGGKMQVVLCPVRIEGFGVEKSRNKARGFLSR